MIETEKSPIPVKEEIEVLRRRVAELEAAEREQRECCRVFREIFDASPHLASLTRMEDGTYLLVNETFCRKTGYTRQEVIGRSPLDLRLYVNPQDRDRLLEAVNRNGRVEGMEISFRRKDGTVIVDLVSARPYRFQGEDCLLFMAEEVTSLKRMEESLRKTQERYRLLVENVGEGVLVAQEGQVKYASPKVFQLLGYRPEEIKSRTFLEYIHPQDRERVVENHQKRLAGAPLPEVYAFRALAKDGQVKVLEIRSSGKAGRPP